MYLIMEVQTMKAQFRFLILISILIFLFSCKEDSPTETNIDVVGTYNLTQVNGKGLPYLAESTSNWEEYLEGGSLDLTQSGRYEYELNWMKVQSSGTIHSTDDGEGRYSVSGNNITFVPTSGNQFTGSITNNILTVNGGLENGVTFTFLKD